MRRLSFNFKFLQAMMLRIFLSLLFCLFGTSIFAETIELKNGKTFQGHILMQDQNSIYFETADGATNIRKSDIQAINGKEYESSVKVNPPEVSAVEQTQGVQPDAEMNEEDQTVQTNEPTSSFTLPQVMKAVPFIKTKGTALDENGKQIEVEGLGSGAIINTNGTILTNAHVVEGAKSITVTLYQERDMGQRSKREYEARVIKKDAVYDLAIIDIHAETPEYFRFANDTEMKVGDEVRACGNPNGLQVSFSKGIISAIRTNKERYDRRDPIINALIKEILKQYSMTEREFDSINWIQTDAAINPGNSGGPLLNSSNQIIGINSWKSVLSDGQTAEGLGFALHVKHLKRFAAGYYKD